MRQVALGLLAAVALTAEPASYVIAPSEGTKFALEVAKTGLMSGKKHIFLFERYKGELTHDASGPANSRVRLVIESASAVCKDTWVSEKDLKKIQKHALEEMLAVEKHRALVFASNSVTAKSATEFVIAGSLTIRGVTKPVSVEVRLQTGADQSLRFEGSAIVKMRDYGLKPPKAALGLIGTENEMVVSFTLRAAPAT